MPKIKNLSGNDIVKILKSFAFVMHSQKGSHIKLIRNTKHQKQILVIPNHKEISVGTIKAIYNQVIKYIPNDELYEHFYSE